MSDIQVTPEEVIDFRMRHELTHEEMDSFFGFSSKGRSSRRWQKNGAPRYVGVLMAYGDRYGLSLMQEMAAYAESESG